MKSKIYLNRILYSRSHSNYGKNIPDLKYLKKASKIVGKILKKNDIIVYESQLTRAVRKKYVFLYLKNILK